jgi:tellurium resistance protein TerD
MAIQLSKGGNINLNKESPLLSNLRIGLGWDVSRFESNGSFDLDVSLFCLENDGKDKILKTEKDFVFYGNLENGNKSIIHHGDNRVGDTDGDDETIDIQLNSVESRIEEISIIVSIYQANEKNQNFGMVSSAYIALYNIDTNETIARYDLSENFSTETSLQFGSLYRFQGEWKFKAVGAGYKAGLAEFIKEYKAGYMLS